MNIPDKFQEIAILVNEIGHQAKIMDSMFIPFQPLLQKKIKANTIDIRTKDILTPLPRSMTWKNAPGKCMRGLQVIQNS